MDFVEVRAPAGQGGGSHRFTDRTGCVCVSCQDLLANAHSKAHALVQALLCRATWERADLLVHAVLGACTLAGVCACVRAVHANVCVRV